MQELYQENWWLDGLAARNESMIWLREASHNYEITAFEAYFDLYVLTGEQRCKFVGAFSVSAFRCVSTVLIARKQLKHDIDRACKQLIYIVCS